MATTGRLGNYRNRRWLGSLAIGFAVALFGVALSLSVSGGVIERTIGLDWLFKIRGATTAPPQVLVIGINSKTGQALDLPRLPRDWPRTIHARLLTRLILQNAEAVVFDFDFSRAKSTEEDAQFANAIAMANMVVLYEWLAGRRERVVDIAGNNAGWTWVEEKQPPIDVLARAARAQGPFPLPKVDQAVFEFWTFKPSIGDAPTTAAIALQLNALRAYDQWRIALKEAQAPGVDDLPARADELTGAETIRQFMLKLRRSFQEDPALSQRVQVALSGMFSKQLDAPEYKLLTALAALYSGPDNQYLNFYGPPGTIRTIPYETALADDVAAQQLGDLSGHVVFVGYSDLYDPDQPDRFFTSFTNSDGVDLSGVEIMATAYANLLTQKPVLASDAITTAIIVSAFGLIIGTLAYFLPATAGVVTVLALGALYGVLAQWRFNETGHWLPLAVPILLQLPLALFLGVMGQYFLGRRRERQIARAISYYLPESIARDMTEKQIDPDSVNKVVFGTCLATDMSGFTTLSEKKSPKELAVFMNEYFDALAKVLKQHQVDVTEFHADTIMCAWTAPETSRAVLGKAVDAAIELSKKIEQFARDHGSMQLNPRIGLYEGHFYLGHTGGGGRYLYSILGDTANTAARLESLNKQLGTQILASESAVSGRKGLLLRPLGSICLAGKADPISVVQVFGSRSNASPEQLALCQQFATALAAFHNKEWSRAIALLEALIASFGNDGPSQLYLARSRKFEGDGETEKDSTIIYMDHK